jgi:ABC-type polysaccharide/polyol phosphate export permease
MNTYARELWASRELLANLTMRDVKGKYRRTIFGQLWSLINPLATMLVYTVVFSVLFRTLPPVGHPSGIKSYPLFLLCGLLPWTFFSTTVLTSITSVVDGESLIKKVYFPRINLPLAAAGAAGFTWLIEMGLLAIALLLFGAWTLPWLPLVLVFMLLQTLLASGLGMMLAILNVHFRDAQHFVAIALQLGMYLTPILYPFSLVRQLGAARGHWVVDLFELNPMEHFVAAFRSLLYDNTWPTTTDSLWCICSAIALFAIGSLVFVRNERDLGRLL